MPELKEHPYFQIEGFTPPSARYCFSGRRQGNMSLSYGDTAHSLKNRELFLKDAGIDYRRLVSGQQVHASTVRYVTQEQCGRGALSYDEALTATDALITDRKNVPLVVLTADCLSIFLYDHENSAIGLVHAGWRSTNEHIASKTLQAMRDNFKTQPKNITAGFGPVLRACCYEVGVEFLEFFPQAVREEAGRCFLDLAAANKQQLIVEGVPACAILDSRICTGCQNADFFSFRKEGAACGRMISVMMLS